MRIDTQASRAYTARDMAEYKRLNALANEARKKIPTEWREIRKDPDWDKQMGDPSMTPDMTRPDWKPE